MNNNHIPSNNIFVSLSQTSPLIITGKELKNNKTTDTGGDDNMIVTDRLTDTEPTLSDSPAAAPVNVSGLLNSVLHRCWPGWAGGQG